MGGPQAAGVLATVRRDNLEAEGKGWSAEEESAFKRPVLEQYEREGHPYYATARLWDDGIIAQGETRRVVALALSAALNAPIPEMRFGVFRMSYRCVGPRDAAAHTLTRVHRGRRAPPAP